MTLTYELNLNSLQIKHYAKYLGQRWSRSKVVVGTRTNKQTDLLLYTATKEVNNDNYRSLYTTTIT